MASSSSRSSTIESPAALPATTDDAPSVEMMRDPQNLMQLLGADDYVRALVFLDKLRECNLAAEHAQRVCNSIFLGNEDLSTMLDEVGLSRNQFLECALTAFLSEEDDHLVSEYGVDDGHSFDSDESSSHSASEDSIDDGSSWSYFSDTSSSLVSKDDHNAVRKLLSGVVTDDDMDSSDSDESGPSKLTFSSICSAE